jgi:biopolymer transport protein ExbD
MRLSKHRRATIAEMDMTPMIDIVLLLIIFFMTVTQVSELNRERLELPKLPGAEDQKQTTLTINVDAAGDVTVSGNRMQVAQLLTLVSVELAKLGDDPQRMMVVLRADERGDCRTVNQIVSALGRMQITRLRIAVQVPQ